jgi:hypothetical protein
MSVPNITIRKRFLGRTLLHSVWLCYSSLGEVTENL